MDHVHREILNFHFCQLCSGSCKFILFSNSAFYRFHRICSSSPSSVLGLLLSSLIIVGCAYAMCRSVHSITVKLQYTLTIKWTCPTFLVLHSNEHLGRLGRFPHPLFHIQFQYGV